MSKLESHQVAQALCRLFTEEVEVNPTGADAWRVLLPFHDEHHDRLEFLAEFRPEGTIVISDDGFLHREVALRTAREDPEADVWHDIATIANRLDLQWGAGYMWKEIATIQGIAPVLMHLSEAINLGLHGSSRHVVRPHVHFWEEVQLFFNDEGVEYTRNDRLTGKSQVDHRIDFTLRNGHLHAVQAIASEASMRRSLNIFYDVLEIQPEIVPISFVDESKKSYSNETFEQLAYKSDVYIWEHRTRFLGYWRDKTGPSTPG